MSDVDPRASQNYKDDKFGIVIDSGSSGSRIQIYKWKDPKTLSKSSDPEILQSPPKITQEKHWTKKISPGISTYNSNKKIKQIWSNHYSELMRFAEEIIPAGKHSETPVFVLSTAGMRLLPKKTQNKILSETCSSIRRNTNFLLPNCDNFVQIIDGSTEGIYGWLGLNYLMGQFKNYDSKSSIHESIGFMDMGGASTQIAFVPSSEDQIKKHNNDLSKVLLRNINGQTQTWDVFVATWLGFGANEARRRFIQQLVNLALVNEELQGNLNDPCLPKGATLDYEYEGNTYKINGVGNYEMCIKSIYPLLMKSIPCDDEPCLFNGIHGPKLDFEKDKFVGISEYWYTANDIFHSGGEYDYKGFNVKVKEYCESQWDNILQNSKNGDYSGLDPDKFLKDACFKASWVMNILHEGFELPRIGFELNSDKEQDQDSQNITNKHIPFKSADSVEGEELSWTLGKILLFASSQIEPADNKNSLDIGIFPSEISGKSFVPGGLIKGGNSNSIDDDSDDEKDGTLGHFIYSMIFFFLLAFFIYSFGLKHFGRWNGKIKKIHVPIEIRRRANYVISKLPGLENLANNFNMYQQMENSYTLEEGVGSSPSVDSSPKQNPGNSSVLRTRSAIGLDEGYDDQSAGTNGKIKPFSPRVNNFLNKPFVIPKKNSFYQVSENNSRESLSRTVSNPSLTRSKMP
ncbi:YND1 [Candida pseudojiufengensis]|uniref:YND1 n=1 Tax=Candida pseudojiufengensis TaxID=497109 RepID=UPI002224DEBF|nr:YND1 [Candida pseudojiufengensis]KAI5962096.1 YND1 [Candida pseudojiufengensis]